MPADGSSEGRNHRARERERKDCMSPGTAAGIAWTSLPSLPVEVLALHFSLSKSKAFSKQGY